MLAFLSSGLANAQVVDDYWGINKSQGDIEVYQSTKMGLVTPHTPMNKATYEPYDELKIIIHGDLIRYYMKGYDQPMAYRMYFSSANDAFYFKDDRGRNVIRREMYNLEDGGSFTLFIIKRPNDYVFLMQYTHSRGEAVIFKKL